MTIDEQHLTRKVNALLKDGYAKRIGGGEFTGEPSRCLGVGGGSRSALKGGDGVSVRMFI